MRTEKGSNWVGAKRQGSDWQMSFFKLETVIVGSVEVGGSEGQGRGVGEEDRVEARAERVGVFEVQERESGIGRSCLFD